MICLLENKEALHMLKCKYLEISEDSRPLSTHTFRTSVCTSYYSHCDDLNLTAHLLMVSVHTFYIHTSSL